LLGRRLLLGGVFYLLYLSIVVVSILGAV
jgi:hypothetical protein